MAVEYLNDAMAFASFGDYSPVARTVGYDTIVAVAGQFGTQRDGSLAGDGDAAAQVEQAFANVGVALRRAGVGFADVLNFRTYVVGRETIPAFMSVRTKVFAEIYPEGTYPPNTLLLVAGLVEERFVVEIEALAVRRTEEERG